MTTARFEMYGRRKERAALTARIPGYATGAAGTADGEFETIGSAWSRALFDGPFLRRAAGASDLPVTNLVFVRSRSGNTIAPNPSVLGGGETDLHLIYEGLSRVDADAVLAGAATARGKDMVFSVWHPELVALRQARGRTRHPAQVVVTERGELPFDEGLMFQEPELRVFVIAGRAAAASIRRRLDERPWVEVIDAGEPLSLPYAMRELRTRGIEIVSAVGGRRTATALLVDRLVSDIYLTTSAIEAGEPHTPYYEGPALNLRRILLKTGKDEEAGVRFEHFACLADA